MTAATTIVRRPALASSPLPAGIATPQRLSVKSRIFKAGPPYVSYIEHNSFDWLPIVLLPGATPVPRCAAHLSAPTSAPEMLRSIIAVLYGRSVEEMPLGGTSVPECSNHSSLSDRDDHIDFTAIREDCFLCVPGNDLLIHQGQHINVIAGLGPIVENYCLISSRTHVVSLADLFAV